MFGVETAQPLEILGTKDGAQSLDGKEEFGVGQVPVLAPLGQGATGNQGVLAPR